MGADHWIALAGALVIGIAIGWMALTNWKAAPGEHGGLTKQPEWMLAGLFPAAGVFLFAGVGAAARAGIGGNIPAALSIVCWCVTIPAIAAGLVCVLLLVALLVWPASVDNRLRFLTPPRRRKPSPT
jgi:hypothetical protein